MTNETVHTDPDEPWLDRGPGSGSLTEREVWSRENARRPQNDNRSGSRTSFSPDPTTSPPSGSSSWEELASINDDMYHPDRGGQNHWSDKQRVVEILTTDLDCTQHQEDRVRWVFDQIGNVREFYPTVSIECVTLAIISLVADAETREFDDWIVRRDEFQSLMDDVGMEMDLLWSIREKIRSETALFEEMRP